jgi:hypothetical protein
MRECCFKDCDLSATADGVARTVDLQSEERQAYVLVEGEATDAHRTREKRILPCISRDLSCSKLAASTRGGIAGGHMLAKR